MPSFNTQARIILKETGLYCTRARLAVVRSLLKAKYPITPDQIVANLHHQFDRATVYRTLNSLVAVDLVHKVFLEERACHYELSHHCTEKQCHPHFTCTSCGNTHCLTEISLPMAKSPHKGFIIQRQQVRLEGLCPACA